MKFLMAAFAAFFLMTPKTLAAAKVLTVFAASSLKDVLEAAALSYELQSGQKVRLVFAASSTLARQIEAGAPADIYVSAHKDWIAYLKALKLVDSGAKRLIARNRLVLIVGVDSDLIPLSEIKGRAQVAIADPAHVPAGVYAREALTHLGLYKSLQSSLVFGANVRLALYYVASGAVPYGIVYESDVMTESRVKVLDYFETSAHSPISYFAVPLKRARVDSEPFLNFLHGDLGRKALVDAGLLIPD